MSTVSLDEVADAIREQPNPPAVGIACFCAGVPGVYEGIPADDYHALDAVSATLLKSARNTLADAKEQIEHPRKSTPEMILGQATHTSVFEPHLLHELFVKAEQCCEVVASGKNKGARCPHPGKIVNDNDHWLCGQHARGQESTTERAILSADEWRDMQGMTRSVITHPEISKILDAEGGVELSILWTDPATGLLCKARVDKYARRLQTFSDLKTCRDAHPDRFPKTIFDLGYHVQAAHYLFGGFQHGIDADTFAFMPVESYGPHKAALYQLEPETVAFGEMEREQLMRRVAECKASGVWPGYPTQAQMIGLPDWAKARLNNRMR